MTISEMHVWFRQYAQQMGMQNVRAILPEQIDNLINTAIKDTIDEVINKSVGTTNDRVITDNSKLANINALRTLYGVKTIFCSTGELVSNYLNSPYNCSEYERIVIEESKIKKDDLCIWKIDNKGKLTMLNNNQIKKIKSRFVNINNIFNMNEI